MATRDSNDLDLGVTQRGAAAEQKLFSRYTLRKVLGRGGMGVVWLAHDDELVRHVAMKFLPDMIVRDREAVEDLKRETRRSLDLTHHHIVRIYDFTQDEQCAAIIMEYVDGESLSALKTRQDGGCFSISTIQSWVGHFCQAMEYAHRQARVVHRDIKPANLMVNGRGDLKVTDFGISRSMSDSMTRVSMSNSAGTLAYMSPEQALGSPPAVGNDVYAFGATVFDMLTGRPPFFRGNLQVQLETVVPPPMESRRAELGNTGEPIPALWEEVIAACLAKRPQDRPQGMMEIASLLGVSGTTTVGFRPSTNRSTAGGSGPGTSPTTPAASTNRTATTPEALKTGTASTITPATAGAAPSYRALQPTRAEDFGYTPTPRHLTESSPVSLPLEIPLVPPTERPPVGHEEFSGTLPMSTTEPPGHLVDSGATKRSGNSALILIGVGAIIFVALLGLWAGQAPGLAPRKAELASHVEAANGALASADLTTAAREIDAVRSLDPKNAALAGLQSAFATKKKVAEAEEARVAADKAAAEKIAAIKAAAEQAAANKAARER
jgi:serine/threonine protein kinase